MPRIQLAVLHVCLASVLVVAAAGCEPPDGAEPLEVSEEALSFYPDTAPDPLPSTLDLVQPNGVVTIPPGARACYPPLPASTSAGIGGQIIAFGLVKPPRVLVFWARDFYSPQSRIFATSVQPDRFGSFAVVLNRLNGFAGFFPGVFQFCIRNPAANTVVVQTNATVTTF